MKLISNFYILQISESYTKTKTPATMARDDDDHPVSF